MDRLSPFWKGFLDGWYMAFPAAAAGMAVAMVVLGQWTVAGIVFVLVIGDVIVSYRLERYKRDQDNG